MTFPPFVAGSCSSGRALRDELSHARQASAGTDGGKDICGWGGWAFGRREWGGKSCAVFFALCPCCAAALCRFSRHKSIESFPAISTRRRRLDDERFAGIDRGGVAAFELLDRA